MATRPIKTDANPNRFEIMIRCDGRQVKHVCAAHDEAVAVERIMRSYAKSDPELISSITSLSVLDAPSDRSLALANNGS